MYHPHISPNLEDAAVRIEALTKRFGDFLAVDELDLSIAPGRIFGLLGPNGAGKSTTIKMLTTLLAPSSGRASVAGFDVRAQPVQVRRRIGYVPQALSADGALTAEENLMLSARLYAVPGPERKPRIESALRFMGLDLHARKLVRAYSGGMIRRLEIAQALLHQPKVLILDEPTIGLDPMARQVVWERLKALRQDLGITVLITTHDMEEADELCDELALLHHGRKVVQGVPENLKAGVGPGADLADVFARYCGGAIEEGGGYKDAGRVRRTARRLS